MAYVDAANYNRIKSMKGYPIGSIIPWSGSQDSIPTGWVVCNGSTIDVNRYPLLYECIGNSYGGTEESTFRLPPLTANNKAVADYYRGYYGYLKNRTNANSFPDGPHVPSPTNNTPINKHVFWNEIGLGFNGDEAGNVQTSYISTIDVVGEFATRPTNLVGQFSPIGLSPGEETISISYNSRKLGDQHMPAHSHGFDFDAPANAWAQQNRLALKYEPDYNCGNRKGNFFCQTFGGGGPCKCITRATTASRHVRYLKYGNNQNHLSEEFLSYSNPSSGGGATGTPPAGGGGTVSQGNPKDFQERVLLYKAGDGYGRGDMLSSGRVFFSSLSNNEVSFSQITGHDHGINTYNFTGNISVINPGVVTNIRLNNVNINNSTGINYGTITMNSSTANLSMIFIIKAY